MLQKLRVQQLDSPSRKGFDAVFNAQLLQEVPAAVDEWHATRILVVASASLSANTDYITELQSSLGSRLVHTKTGVGQHSPYKDVRDIATHIQRLKVDCVISIGSSSYNDASQIACLLASNLPPGFEEDDMEGLVDKDRGIADSKDGRPLAPRSCKLVLVPTSLSAAEWNAISSASNKTGKKQHFGSWDSGQADLIILDPKLASTAPERLWLSSGVRCIDHCVELMCNPMSGGQGYEGVHVHAEKGLRCMVTGLAEYKEAKDKAELTSSDGEDQMLKGISECQFGSREALTGLIIWRVPMGPSHAIGHQLGAVAHVMHGVTSCILLAPTLRWQIAHLSDPHYQTAQDKVLDIFNSMLGWHEASAADAVERFVARLGLPTRLAQVGVDSDEQLRSIAHMTTTDVWGGGKRQLEFEQVLAILESAR